jgi:hypothetical protein
MEAFHRDLLSVEGDPTLRRPSASASAGSMRADDRYTSIQLRVQWASRDPELPFDLFDSGR